MFRKHLLSSLHDYLDTLPSIGAAFTGHHTNVAPRGTEPPYIVVRQISVVPEFTTGAAFVERTLLQVDVYATSDDDALNYGTLLADVLDSPPIQVNTGWVMGFRRIGGGDVTTEEMSEYRGEPLSRYSLDYEAFVSRYKESQVIESLAVQGLGGVQTEVV